MSWERVWAVIVKDWKEMLRNPQAIVPILLLPVVFAVALPLVLIILGANPVVTASITGMDAFIQNFPKGVIPPEFDRTQGVLYALLIYFFAPIFLMIPVVVATVTASVSFAGEKEKRTLEGLLFSPLKARELVLAKIAVSFIPSLVLSWVAFLLYALVVNIAGQSVFNRAILPTSSWLVLVFLLVPTVSFLVVALVVGVSKNARTVQSAQSVAVFMVLPLIALAIAQVAGLALLDLSLALLLSGIVVLIDIVSVAFLVSKFNREELVLKL